MNIMRLGSRILGNSAPVALIATGAAIAVAFPPVRRSLRAVAVVTTRGALALADGVKQLGDQIKDSTADIVAEARTTGNIPHETISETVDCFKNTAKRQSRRVAVATATGALALSDKAKSLRKDFKEVVEEARAGFTARIDDNYDEVHAHESQHGEVSESARESSPDILEADLENRDIARRRTSSKKPV